MDSNQWEMEANTHIYNFHEDT